MDNNTLNNTLNYTLNNTVIGKIRSLIYHPVFNHGPQKPFILDDAVMDINSEGSKASIIVGFRPAVVNRLNFSQLNKFWVINCCDSNLVTACSLKKFIEFCNSISAHRVKGTVITSRFPFKREAVNMAIQNNIGIARVSPLYHATHKDFAGHRILGPNVLELKKALCDTTFGNRRMCFYGFTTSGKTEQLGSMESYLRFEMVNF
ncbi:MAG: hypothetical protein CVU89_04120 [Firmicutes bacterium HGW-Firmicutes-14]|nr:MAG: hypothetical protein CVU89_04120 [Firmicutes bacterium HGW-Firmicutes-14]